MKLVSYRIGGRPSFGLLQVGGILDLAPRLGVDSLRTLLGEGGLPRAQALRNEPPDLAADEVALCPVIPDPATILCVGINYEDHRLETQRPVMDYPTIFLRGRESLQAHGQPLLIPRESGKFDYEGELAVVIGTGGRRIDEGDAWAHVAGVSCFNEGSVRDWQNHTQQFTPGKNFPHTGAFGPALVTLDELPADHILRLETRLNGTVVQSASTDQMIFSIPRQIAYISTFMTLQAGDVLVTGTPGGVGARRNPPLWLKDGDEVEVEISHVGVLRNRCLKEV